MRIHTILVDIVLAMAAFGVDEVVVCQDGADAIEFNVEAVISHG